MNEYFEKMILFVGSHKVEKSEMILSVAKIMSQFGKVLVIDTSQSQEIYSCFNFNTELEKHMTLNNLKPFLRHGIDILANDPTNITSIDYSKLESFDFSEYKYILVEADETVSYQWGEKCKNIFLVQSNDKYVMLKNKIILKNLCNFVDSEKINFIFNNYVDCKANIPYITLNMINDTEAKFKFIYKEEIEIPFDEQNLVTCFDNKVEGSINLKHYTNEYKEAIYSICNIIKTMDIKTFKKLVS